MLNFVAGLVVGASLVVAVVWVVARKTG